MNRPHARGGPLVRTVSGRGIACEHIAGPLDAESRKREGENEQLEL